MALDTFDILTIKIICHRPGSIIAIMLVHFKLNKVKKKSLHELDFRMQGLKIYCHKLDDVKLPLSYKTYILRIVLERQELPVLWPTLLHSR
jgi:hypothetical protein